jgi:drug/metabolite transporter (DMT)-like permease
MGLVFFRRAPGPEKFSSFFAAYIWLIKVKPPAVVSTYAYINPLVAVLLGLAFAGETISILQLGALALILCGVLFVNIPKYRTLL